MARSIAPSLLVLFAAVGTATTACRTGSAGAPLVIQPGSPGQDSRVLSGPDVARQPVPAHTRADIAFMQGMIHHHAQALDMVELLRTRTGSDDMRKLAQRIELSQRDEIQMMREWLEARGAEAPGEHAHHAPGAPMMPGMLTPAEMDRLAAATGAEFDRLFLEYMIKHHAGALVMVKELFSTPGAGQESEIFAFASDVDADQLIEIRRMDRMLKERQQ